MTQRLGRWGIVLVPRRWFAFWAGSDCEWWISLPFSINQQREDLFLHPLWAILSAPPVLISQEIKKKVTGPSEYCCWRRTREGRKITIIFSEFVCFTLLSPCSYSLLVSLIMPLTPPSNETLSLNLFKKERTFASSEGEAKVNKSCRFICLYPSILSVSPSSASPPRKSSHRPFFPEFIPALMDILSTDGFWFRPLMLSASPNIHFGCSAPSHWFLWRWNSDWTDLSWRPRAPTCALHCYSIWRRKHPIAWLAYDARPANQCTLYSATYI